jgi:hypothetical protein
MQTDWFHELLQSSHAALIPRGQTGSTILSDCVDAKEIRQDTHDSLMLEIINTCDIYNHGAGAGEILCATLTNSTLVILNTFSFQVVHTVLKIWNSLSLIKIYTQDMIMYLQKMQWNHQK